MNSTVSVNRAAGDGGGVYNQSSFAANFSLRVSIVVENEASGSPPDAGGAFTSGGCNPIGDPSGSGGFGPTDLQNVSEPGPNPEGLENNGGPTHTVALEQNSPAVDLVAENCPRRTRGACRARRTGTASCGAGAYEIEAPQ